MAYEIELFGTNVILIEPGIIKSNFNNNLKIGKNVYPVMENPLWAYNEKENFRIQTQI